MNVKVNYIYVEHLNTKLSKVLHKEVKNKQEQITIEQIKILGIEKFTYV